MTLEDAATAIEVWLSWHYISIAPARFVRELAGSHIQITVLQVTPHVAKRVFELAPLEVLDCYECKEIAV